MSDDDYWVEWEYFGHGIKTKPLTISARTRELVRGLSLEQLRHLKQVLSDKREAQALLALIELRMEVYQ